MKRKAAAVSSQLLGTNFYIQYKTFSPMAINTHFRIGKERVYNLETVRDLMTAYQMSDGSPLANVSPYSMDIRLYYGITREQTDISREYFISHWGVVETSLEPNCPLTALGTFGQNPDSPLVIKKDDEMFDFSPLEYKLEVPFHDCGRSDFPLLGRDDIVKKINDITLDDTNTTFKPIIMCTSSGMGKTFLVNQIAQQNVKPHLKNIKIQYAGECGRIVWDTLTMVEPFLTKEEADSYLLKLMISRISELFDGTHVDGIQFEERIHFETTADFNCKQGSLNDWLRKVKGFNVDQMMDEYIRLTNIAFNIDPNSEKGKMPPVFLFDNIRSVCRPKRLGPPQEYYPGLLNLLTALSGRHKPICICISTSHGDIGSMSKGAPFAPKILNLKPFTGSESLQFWKERTRMINSKDQILSLDNLNYEAKKDLCELIYSTYHIPQFLGIAYDVCYFKTKQNEEITSYTLFKGFSAAMKIYFPELYWFFWNDNPVLRGYLQVNEYDMLHIILCCAVRYKVNDISEFVPNTKLQWSAIIQMSIVFPDGDGYFIFPFHTAWFSADNWQKDEVKKVFSEVLKSVKNLDIEGLFPTFKQLLPLKKTKLKAVSNDLFAASLAIKYYLVAARDNPSSPDIPFDKLYEFPNGETPEALRGLTLNLSNEINFPSYLYSLDGRGIINSNTMELLDLFSNLKSKSQADKLNEILKMEK